MDAMPKTDAEWQAHDDAHALIRAEVIKADAKRLKAAKAAAAKILKERAAEQKAMAKVAADKG